MEFVDSLETNALTKAQLPSGWGFPDQPSTVCLQKRMRKLLSFFGRVNLYALRVAITV